MERQEKSVHPKHATWASLYGRSFIVWGLSAMLMSLPAAAENVPGGGKIA